MAESVQGIDGTDYFPKQYENKFGKPLIRRGNLIIEKEGEDPKKIMLLSWDAVSWCRGIRCPISDDCELASAKLIPPTGQKCGLTMAYLKGISLLLFRNYKDQLDEQKWARVGLELLPLYKGLCRMKMVELSLHDILIRDRYENPRPHPIFKEMREQIKLIEMIWKNLGLDGPPVSLDSGLPEQGGDGDLTYHDRLEMEIEAERRERRGE